MKIQKNLDTTKTSVFDGVVETTSDIKVGFYINDREVETKIDRFIYNSGKVLTKVYCDNRLCMIQIAKS